MKCKKIVLSALSLLILPTLLSTVAPAVTSVITRHNTSADFLKGDTENVVVDSAGTLRLARRTTHVDCGDLLKDVWAVNCLLADNRQALYLGTGPNGKVIRILNDQAVQVYPVQTAGATDEKGDGIGNQHVFALGLDVADRLLIAISGEKGQLIRLGAEAETVFEHEKVQYIFAIARDADNNIYLGTGPEGLIFRLNPFCQQPEIFYDAQDKNILSLAIADGVLYAGADQRGIVYKLTLDGKATSVLYDSDQAEITALLTDAQGNVYAAATSAQAAASQLKASSVGIAKAPGRPDSAAPAQTDNDAASLKTDNSDKAKDEQQPKPAPQAPQPPAPRSAGQIYKISPDGFVTPILSEMAVFYALRERDNCLWLGTGSNGRLFTIDPITEEKSIAYEDKLSAQITALENMGSNLYLGLSNPARLVRLEKGFETQGIFRSQLVDATQPARWGKLQLEATLPGGCQIQLATRSGNVGDPNDATFSAWSDEIPLNGPVDLKSPVGRFLQYRLTLKTSDAERTPLVREATVSHVVPNLAPMVTAIQAARSRDKNKPTIIEIAFTAQDANRDELIFALEFRQIGRTRWTLLKEDLAQPKFEWDGRTVEDGRYEVRVTASDRKGNSPATALTGARISDPFVIDNTPPVIETADVQLDGSEAVIKLSVRDAFTVLGKVAWTVNSDEQWNSVLPDDQVYDTVTETFTLRAVDLKSGPSIIAVSVADDLGNTLYKTFEVDVP